MSFSLRCSIGLHKYQRIGPVTKVSRSNGFHFKSAIMALGECVRCKRRQFIQCWGDGVNCYLVSDSPITEQEYLDLFSPEAIAMKHLEGFASKKEDVNSDYLEQVKQALRNIQSRNKRSSTATVEDIIRKRVNKTMGMMDACSPVKKSYPALDEFKT